MALFNKKPKTENLQELRDISRDVVEEDFIPYACHWNPCTIVTRNGEVLQSIRISGAAADAATEEKNLPDLRAKIREALQTYVTATHYGIWIHTVRRRKNLQTGGQFKRDFSGYLDRFWKDRNDWEHQYSNEIYITLVREGQAASLLDPATVGRGILPRIDIRHREQYLDDVTAKMTGIVEKITKMLSPYGASRLGINKRDGVYYSDINSFLAKLITFTDMEIPVADMDLAQQLTDYDVTFGFNAMESRLRTDAKRRFAALLTIKEYRELTLESLDHVLQIPCEFIISQCFTFANTKQSLKSFEYQKELFDVSKAATLADKTGLMDVINSNQGKVTDFGEHQLQIFLVADSLKMMESAVARGVNALSDLGLPPMREDIKLEECYWAHLPGNFEFITRLRPLNTARIAGFANLGDFAMGQQNGNHWGTAITTLYSATHTPYFFNFHEGSNGHTLLIGPEDAGKTVLVNFFVAQARKYDGQLFYFDQNRESEIFLRSIGGAYYNPTAKADPRPYTQVMFNPLALDDTPKNREFWRRWLSALTGGREDGPFFAACDNAIAKVMQLPKEQRRISALAEAMRTQDAAVADLLLPWISGGEHAALFDNVVDSLNFTDKICGFEMAEALQQKATLLPLLYYLLHRVTLALDGTPGMIVIDEAWTILDHPFLAARLKEWLGEWRSKNAMVLLTTEHVERAINSRLNPLFIAETATHLYLPDEAADESYSKAFNLSERDVSYLTVMNTQDRHFLIKRKDESIVLEVNLSGMPDIQAVLCAGEAQLKIMEQSIEAAGLQASQWMPKFLEQI